MERVETVVDQALATGIYVILNVHHDSGVSNSITTHPTISSSALGERPFGVPTPNDFALFNGNFSTIPAFVGEWDASTSNTETAARWKYFDYFIQTANKYKYSHVIWDNGLDHSDRTTNTWR